MRSRTKIAQSCRQNIIDSDWFECVRILLSLRGEVYSPRPLKEVRKFLNQLLVRPPFVFAIVFCYSFQGRCVGCFCWTARCWNLRLVSS